MEYILTSQQMKQCDQDTIHKLGIPSMVLMERAALATVEEMLHFHCDMKSVLVVCGSGNNGGDGFAIARLLDEMGVRVTIAFIGRETSLTEETSLQKKICENCGIKISSNFQENEYTTIVDAVFGIGLSRDVEGRYAEIIQWINAQDAVRVAVDIPSGVETNSGKILGTAVKADLTVTFAYKKAGQILYPGTEYCGKLVCRKIGIPVKENSSHHFFSYDRSDLARIPVRPARSNKGSFGKVLLIAGSSGMSGAACLSAMGAYRSGSGLVRIFTPECNRQVIQTILPEAIVSTWDGSTFPENELKAALNWATVVGIGPGLGQEQAAEKLLAYTIQHFSGPIVVDADALNLLSRNIGILKLSARCSNMILTPHIGEMMRLTGLPKDTILEDLIKTASEFAAQHQVICALKDARTIVSDGTDSYLNQSGNSGMATGGSGDVLTGIICGLLAQGMEPYEAACMGVYLHGLAGDAARDAVGAYGMIAGEIADHLPDIMR